MHIAELLAAPDLDKEQLKKEFARYRAMVEHIEITAQTALLDSASLLTPENRKRITELPPPRHHSHMRPPEHVDAKPVLPSTQAPSAKPPLGTNAPVAKTGTSPTPDDPDKN